MKTHFVCLLAACLFWGCTATKSQNNTGKKSTPQAINMCGPTKDGLNTEPGTDGTLAPLFKGLDVYNYRITTDSKKAQQYFDQGLMLTYGFNHAEASRSFREVIRHGT
jgi:hypothetical protein